MGYVPPFTLTSEILELVAIIAQKTGQIETYERLSASPQLRKENRIRTIHSSLAIENNSLSLEQVTAVIEGKHIIAPARDILEVQNALATYERLNTFELASATSLLNAHAVLMKGLTAEAGRYRSGDVGVFDNGRLIHAGTPANYVPDVMADLFEWLRTTDMHPLIASCVFHYELEFIHPFADGNGRMGRLWQTLILSDWNDLYAWLPVESLVKENQQAYYDALNASDKAGNCTSFVTFMLNTISLALDDAIRVQSAGGINDGINDGISNRSEVMKLRLLRLIKEHPSITVAQMADALGISKRQAERTVANLKAQGRLVRVGANRNGHWEVRDE